MKRHLRAAVLSLPFWGAACFGIADVTTMVTALAGTVTTAVNVVVFGKSSTSDARLIQSFDRDAKTTANGLEAKVDNAADRLELMIEKVRMEMQNDIKQLGGRVNKVEEHITKVEKHITKVEDDIKDVKDAVEEVKKLLSKPDEPNPFNRLRR